MKVVVSIGQVVFYQVELAKAQKLVSILEDAEELEQLVGPDEKTILGIAPYRSAIELIGANSVSVVPGRSILVNNPHLYSKRISSSVDF